MESAILHNIRCLSFSVVYKSRRIPSYDLKHTLTSLSSKVDREYIYLCFTGINREYRGISGCCFGAFAESGPYSKRNCCENRRQRSRF